MKRTSKLATIALITVVHGCDGDVIPYDPPPSGPSLSHTLALEHETGESEIWVLRLPDHKGVFVALLMENGDLASVTVSEDRHGTNRSVDVQMDDSRRFRNMAYEWPGKWMRVDYGATGQYSVEFPAKLQFGRKRLNEYDGERIRIPVRGEWIPAVLIETESSRVYYTKLGNQWMIARPLDSMEWSLEVADERGLPPELERDEVRSWLHPDDTPDAEKSPVDG